MSKVKLTEVTNEMRRNELYINGNIVLFKDGKSRIYGRILKR